MKATAFSAAVFFVAFTASSGAGQTAPASPATLDKCNHEAQVIESREAQTFLSFDPASSGQIVIGVVVNADGTVKQANILQSSFDFPVNADALRLVRAVKFAPKVKDCAPTEGSYVFRLTR